MQQYRVIGHRHMIQRAGLPGGNNSLAEFRGAGKPGMGAEDTVLTDLHVMSKVTHGVDHGARTDDRCPVRPAINIGTWPQSPRDLL